MPNETAIPSPSEFSLTAEWILHVWIVQWIFSVEIEEWIRCVPLTQRNIFTRIDRNVFAHMKSAFTLSWTKHSLSRFRAAVFSLPRFQWQYRHFSLVLSETPLEEILRVTLNVSWSKIPLEKSLEFPTLNSRANVFTPHWRVSLVRTRSRDGLSTFSPMRLGAPQMRAIELPLTDCRVTVTCDRSRSDSAWCK